MAREEELEAIARDFRKTARYFKEGWNSTPCKRLFEIVAVAPTAVNLFSKLIAFQRRIKAEDTKVSGLNVGANCGESAGQTVSHAHIHLIPRRKGDMDNPRGGVRGVIPERQSY